MHALFRDKRIYVGYLPFAHTRGLKFAPAGLRLGTFLESLGISTDDAWSLFVMIDTDRNGLVDMEEFVTGCMQCLGSVCECSRVRARCPTYSNE